MAFNSNMEKKNKNSFISWRQRIGLKECPYMERWVFNFYFFSIRIHHWFRSDDDRCFHDHPWWFWTLVIAGEYGDESPSGFQLMKRWTLQFRPALHQHTVHLLPEYEGKTWTIVLTGPYKREWGFWTEKGFMKAKKYFYRIGHHPCKPGEKRQRTFERQ